MIWGDRSIITEYFNITGDTEVKAGADGKIAPETRKFTATKKIIYQAKDKL